MNVPMCALSSILRANGYEEVAPDSICIDEKMLSNFADAYIRKMKNYFLSSVRNIENLTYQEFTDLNEFYNTFKKQEAKYTRRAEWSHIDTGLLRNAFMDKIKKLTPRRKSRFELFFERLVEKCGYDTPCFTLDYREPSRKNLVFETLPPDILCRVFVSASPARSPVFSHLTSSLRGLWTIRAYKAEQKFQELFDAHQDLHSGL